MIRTITLKFGSTPNQQPVKLEVTPVTIFVGPNNSGKSKILQEINKFCTDGKLQDSNIILESIELSELSEEQISIIVEDSMRESSLLELSSVRRQLQPGHILICRSAFSDSTLSNCREVAEQQFIECLQQPNSFRERFCPWYLARHKLILDGKSRITLVNQQEITDLQKPPQNVLDVLFRDDKKRQEVRRIAFDAFKNYFVIDPTGSGILRIRYSEEKPDENLEKSLTNEAVEFYRKAQNITDAGDGVKAFTGIMTQIIAGDPKIILIDEPEAFLHPALSFKLGKEVAVSAFKSDKQLFVSTHSSNFLMGCIQSGIPINIVRLTYQNKMATARTLPSDKLLHLMRNPLLRSTKVLDGLFYESVIVTEGDSDRPFYQEINERLLQFCPDRGIPNCLFLNAQNKQTICKIIKPLRELGIPAAAIADIDIIKDEKKSEPESWNNFLKSGFISENRHKEFNNDRSNFEKKCIESGKDMKKDGGIEILSESDREAANNLFNQVDEYGLFIFRIGELESWLKHLNVNGHSSRWLIKIFKKMGENPDEASYVKPQKGDVWDFIEKVGLWLKDPKRKGIPS